MKGSTRALDFEKVTSDSMVRSYKVHCLCAISHGETAILTQKINPKGNVFEATSPMLIRMAIASAHDHGKAVDTCQRDHNITASSKERSFVNPQQEKI